MAIVESPLKYDEVTKYLDKVHLQHLHDIIVKYSLDVSKEDYRLFERLKSAILEDKLSVFLIDKYVELIVPHADELGILTHTEHSEELLTSGLYCYLGIYFFGLCLIGSEILDQIDHMFNFVLLYLYVDHYLDDNKVDNKIKTEIVKIMMKQLYHPDVETAPLRMKGLVTAYLRLIEKSPMVKNVLIDLFLAEIEGVKYQQNPHCTRDEYLRIAELKGGKVGGAIAGCLGIQPDKSHFKIGACVQLLDDMIDANHDMANGINTIATHDLQKFGSLDHLYYYTARQIDAIDSKFFIFRGLFTLNLIYALSHSNLFTRQLRRRFLSYGQIRYDRGYEMMKIVNNYLRNKIRLKIPRT